MFYNKRRSIHACFGAKKETAHAAFLMTVGNVSAPRQPSLFWRPQLCREAKRVRRTKTDMQNEMNRVRWLL